MTTAVLHTPIRTVARVVGIAGAGSCVLAACSVGDGRELTIKGEVYRFPTGHVTSITSEPHQFVRLSPPDVNFDLVYDSRLREQPSRPLIYSITDGPYPTVDSFDTPAGHVACRRAPHPNGGCGLALELRGTRWSILFPEMSLPEAASIRDRAVSLLEGYSA